MWTLTIVYALFFGVCVLPVLLSMVGPPPYQSATLDDHEGPEASSKEVQVELTRYAGKASVAPAPEEPGVDGATAVVVV